MTLFGDDAVAMGAVESPDVNRGTVLHVYLSNHDILASNSPQTHFFVSTHTTFLPVSLGHDLLVGDAAIVSCLSWSKTPENV